MQPTKLQDDSLLEASPRQPEGKTSPADSLPAIGAKGRGGPLAVGGSDGLKGGSVNKSMLVPLEKGKKKKGS